MNKAVTILGLVLGLGGIMFAFLPHEAHNVMGNFFSGPADGMATGEMADMHSEMGDDVDHHMSQGVHMHTSHGVHMTWGIAVTVVGLGLALAGWKIFD